jgi:hypothetical protein
VDSTPYDVPVEKHNPHFNVTKKKPTKSRSKQSKADKPLTNVVATKKDVKNVEPNKNVSPPKSTDGGGNEKTNKKNEKTVTKNKVEITSKRKTDDLTRPPSKRSKKNLPVQRNTLANYFC